MYRCDTCGKNSKRYEGCHVTPVSFRKKVYNTVEGIEIPDDHAAIGYEIVRQEKKCSDCHAKWMAGERPELPSTKKIDRSSLDRGRRGRRGRFDDKRGRRKGGRNSTKERR